MSASVLVFMGVSGSGKSTIGREVANRIGWPYTEGDDFHPEANVARMRAGIPLNDADRAPWLAAIAEWIGERLDAGKHAVITCSALKRSYRDTLRQSRTDVVFVYLEVPVDELRRRVASRHHEYMPASLLDSQLAALEEPADDEPGVITVHSGGPVERVVDATIGQLVASGVVPPR